MFPCKWSPHQRPSIFLITLLIHNSQHFQLKRTYEDHIDIYTEPLNREHSFSFFFLNLTLHISMWIELSTPQLLRKLSVDFKGSLVKALPWWWNFNIRKEKKKTGPGSSVCKLLLLFSTLNCQWDQIVTQFRSVSCTRPWAVISSETEGKH